MERIDDASVLGLVKNPICRRFFILFRAIGTVLMAITLVADFMYTFKTTFSSKELLVFCVSIYGLRFANPILVVIKNLCKKVCNKERNTLSAASVYEER